MNPFCPSAVGRGENCLGESRLAEEWLKELGGEKVKPPGAHFGTCWSLGRAASITPIFALVGGVVKARITVNLTATGEFEIRVNERGRALLVRELQKLGERNDHFHLGPRDFGEVELSTVAYMQDDKILDYGKVLFRTDAWDQKFYPHVL